MISEKEKSLATKSENIQQEKLSIKHEVASRLCQLYSLSYNKFTTTIQNFRKPYSCIAEDLINSKSMLFFPS